MTGPRVKLSEAEQGKRLAIEFLEKCQREERTGVTILNAVGNILVGFFGTTRFDSHDERMAEVNNWCEALKYEVAAGRAALAGHVEDGK